MKIKNFIGNTLNIFFESSRATEVFLILMLVTRDN